LKSGYYLRGFTNTSFVKILASSKLLQTATDSFWRFFGLHYLMSEYPLREKVEQDFMMEYARFGELT
jgi:hypothetical protein